jgi:hypothetical protein
MAQVDFIFRIDKSGIPSMRLVNLNLPAYVILDEDSLKKQ